MVSFDSTTVSNIFLAVIALTNIVVVAILYERFEKKRVIIIKARNKKENDEKP
jgi:high-affinity nickel permease